MNTYVKIYFVLLPFIWLIYFSFLFIKSENKNIQETTISSLHIKDDIETTKKD